MSRAGAAARPYPGAAPWRPRERAAYFATKASDYISFADPPRVVDNSTDFCIEIVVRVRTATTSWDTPFSKQAAITNGLYFSANVVGSGFDFYVNDTPQGFSFPGVTVGQARYYCVNYVNATLYGFTAPYDGSATQSLSNAGTAFPAAATTTNEPIQIGACSAQGSGWAGEVLWVRWWNKGLDNDTLSRIWNRRFIPGEKPPRDLAFWWDAAHPLRDLVSGQIGTITGTVARSNGYAYPPYLINTRDRVQNLPLTSIQAASGGASASGAPSLPFFNAAGVAAQRQSASGAPNLPKLNAAGAAVMLPSATGTPSLPFLSAAGSALQTHAATGTPALPFLLAAGVAVTGAYSATGTPSLPFLSAVGSAVQRQTSTGTPSLPFLTASGAAVMLPSATGAPALPFLSTAGSALQTQSASGADALPFMTAAGVAVFGSAATGSGTPSLPFINTAGTAIQTQTASGTPSLPFLSASGVAVFGSAAAATGTPSLPFLSAAGVAVQRQTASGAPSLPFLSATGAAVLVPRATGAPSLPFLSASGASAIRYTATGAANLPRLGASGSVFFGDALGVVVTALARYSRDATASARWSIIAAADARNE